MDHHWNVSNEVVSYKDGLDELNINPNPCICGLRADNCDRYTCKFCGTSYHMKCYDGIYRYRYGKPDCQGDALPPGDGTYMYCDETYCKKDDRPVDACYHCGRLSTDPEQMIGFEFDRTNILETEKNNYYINYTINEIRRIFDFTCQTGSMSTEIPLEQIDAYFYKMKFNKPIKLVQYEEHPFNMGENSAIVGITIDDSDIITYGDFFKIIKEDALFKHEDFTSFDLSDLNDIGLHITLESISKLPKIVKNHRSAGDTNKNYSGLVLDDDKIYLVWGLDIPM